jgi:hypothetical protein
MKRHSREKTMTVIRTRLALTLLGALLLGGCSWFSHKPSTDEVSAQAGEATPQPDAAAASEAPGPTPAADPTAAANPTPVANPPTATSATPVATQGPGIVALDFLTMHQRLGNSGLPAVDALNAYDAFLCPSLADALRAAKVRQEQFKASQPDEKPPLVDGDLFSSLAEGPEFWSVAESRIGGDNAVVVLDLSHGEGSKATRWKDSMILQLDDGVWCIADVEYHGNWPYANRGRLSETLAR